MWAMKNNAETEVLIFLDIDGVLNTSNSFNTKYEIHQKNVDALGHLMDKLSKKKYLPKVILTSTWRLGYEEEFEKCSPQIQKLIQILEKSDIRISGKTPIYKEKTRDVEIRRFVRGYQLTRKEFTYVVLDDDLSIFDKNSLEELNVYKVNQHTGLTDADVVRIVRMVQKM